jgi:hypothetical protein
MDQFLGILGFRLLEAIFKAMREGRDVPQIEPLTGTQPRLSSAQPSDHWLKPVVQTVALSVVLVVVLGAAIALMPPSLSLEQQAAAIEAECSLKLATLKKPERLPAYRMVENDCQVRLSKIH